MKKEKWNDNWYFWERQDAFALLWNIPENAKQVKLPHDAMLAHKSYANSTHGGNTGYRDGGDFAYSKKLELGDIKTQKYLLQFDGVYENAAVYVNGNCILRHPYGYTRFYVDLTKYLLPNQENEIRVLTNNKALSSRWYTGAGIYRDVYLLTAEEKVYILPDGFKVQTDWIDKESNKAKISVRTTIQNDASESKNVKLKLQVSEAGNTHIEEVHLAANAKKEIVTSMLIDNAKLWDADNPFLYTCSGELYFLEGKAERIDGCETQFGIRTIAIDAKNGFQINGQSVKLRGACIHNDLGVIGAATFKDAEYRRISRLKEAGFNAIRMSHHPASSVLLEVCDKLGMYVMNEAFDMWTRNKTNYDYANYFFEWWERDLSAMIDCSYNHPSVVMYSLGNEIPEIGLPQGRDICRQLAARTKELDGTRFSTVAINGIFSVGDIVPEIMGDLLADKDPSVAKGNVNEFLTFMDQNIDKVVVHRRISERVDEIAKIVDVTSYNYMIARYEMDAEVNPDRVILGSETYPPEIGRIWNLMAKHPQMIGDFTWTGWDYIGEAGIGIPAANFGEGGFGAQFPCQLAYVGDIDLTGFRRPCSYYREIVFGLRNDPYIAVTEPAQYPDHRFMTPWVLTGGTACWDYPGFEGQLCGVEIFSPGDEVELFVNNHSQGRKAIEDFNRHKVTYEIPYEPGSLKAVAYENGEQIGEMLLQTPKKAYSLVALIQEKYDELTYIEIRCQDDNGVLVQSCNDVIQVSTEGSLETWLGTGNPKPEHNYLDMETSLWQGRALLVVRKNTNADSVKITICSDYDSIKLEI